MLKAGDFELMPVHFEFFLRALGNAELRTQVYWNHGGSAMIALQEMLVQTEGKTIRLLPAWPKDWDVQFVLHAPYETTVEGRVQDKKLVAHKVTPPDRMKDVILPEEWK